MNMDYENAEKLETLKKRVTLYNQRVRSMKMDFDTMSIDEICDNISICRTLEVQLDHIRRGLLDVRRK
jgi:hypothetical protein